VFHAADGAMHGTIENLSASGALVQLDMTALPAVPSAHLRDVELQLGVDSSRVSARTVRVERDRIALEFAALDPAVRETIEAAIDGAVRAAQRRPVLVVDAPGTRRHDLVARLAARGMTPLAPRTPLEAIELLTRAYLHVNVALLGPSFGQSTDELRALVSDSFPWVSTADISDDVEATVDRALAAWQTTDVARLSHAIA
jgi:hypothetical protein